MGGVGGCVEPIPDTGETGYSVQCGQAFSLHSGPWSISYWQNYKLE